MSEIHRYNVVTMLSEGGNTIGYDPHGPAVVMASEFDRVAAERDALQQRLNAADQRIDDLTAMPSAAERQRLTAIIERYPNGDPLEYDAAVRKIQQ
ncbi:hypothetical protein ACYZT9_10345 [Pseudomonas sp. ZT5P21]